MGEGDTRHRKSYKRVFEGNRREEKYGFEILTICDTNPQARRCGDWQTRRKHLHQSGAKKFQGRGE